MPEPLASNYPANLDDDTTLFGDAINLLSFILGGTIDAGTGTIPTTVTLSGQVNTPCYLLIDSEVIYANGISGTDFTGCVRGISDTTPASHTGGAAIKVVYAAGMFNQLKRAIVAIETELGTDVAGSETNLKTRLTNFVSSMGPSITALTTKATPVDADELILADSAASNASKKLTWANLKTTLKNYFDSFYASDHNYLINGGFSFAARQAPTPGTLTTYSANTYSADRWKTYAENASYQYARQDGTSETGLTSLYFGAFKKITNAGKMFIYQAIEGRDSLPARGKTVTFQCQMKASSSKTIRMGIFQLTSSGTLDTIPSPIVTAAGANTVDPTMGTNVSVITGAESKSVTTSMQTFSVSVTVPATSKNIICAIWTDSQFAVDDILYIAEAGLYLSSTTQIWKPRLSGAELSLCQRYCYITPDGTQVFGETGNWNVAQSTTRVVALIPFPVEMRIAPTLSTSGNFRVDDGATATAVTAFTQSNTTGQRAAAFVDVAAGLTAFRSYKLSANNDNTAKLIFTSEL